ncbi:MAG: polysaccharide deacetylase family protein, partial [Chloroflexota bacterium]
VQIREIHEAGHEVGSHTFHHDWLPALNPKALKETLVKSKDALEQCIGAPVTSFVPPYNQPFDYPQVGSVSLAERRAVKEERTDLGRLCLTLKETGYQFCRVAYRPITTRIAEMIRRKRLDQPARLTTIKGVTCVRLNTPGGFDTPTLDMLNQCTENGGIIVAYGHPHSLTAGNSQDESWLVPFLEKVQTLQKQGLLKVRLPRDLIN